MANEENPAALQHMDTQEQIELATAMSLAEAGGAQGGEASTDAAATSGAPPDLPANIEAREVEGGLYDGQMYYVDHDNKTTSWTKPGGMRGALARSVSFRAEAPPAYAEKAADVPVKPFSNSNFVWVFLYAVFDQWVVMGLNIGFWVSLGLWGVENNFVMYYTRYDEYYYTQPGAVNATLVRISSPQMYTPCIWMWVCFTLYLVHQLIVFLGVTNGGPAYKNWIPWVPLYHKKNYGSSNYMWLVKYLKEGLPAAHANIEWYLEASHTERRGSGKNKRTVKIVTFSETLTIPCDDGTVSTAGLSVMANPHTCADVSEPAKDWLMRVGMARGTMFQFICRYKYEYDTDAHKKFMEDLKEEYRRNNESRDETVVVHESLRFSNTVDPTLVDKGGGSEVLRSLLMWDIFMLCNFLFLSAPYIIFYHFSTIRVPYTVKKVFTPSTDKDKYPHGIFIRRHGR